MREYLFGVTLLLGVAVPVQAQDNSNIEGEVVVTAQRASARPTCTSTVRTAV